MPSSKLSLLKRLRYCLLLLAMFPRPQVLAQSAARTSRVVSYETVATSEYDFILKQCVLDTSGHTSRAFVILPKGFSLAVAASSGTRNLYLLRKVFADTVLLLLTDSLGQVKRQERQYMPRLGSTALGSTSDMYVRPVLFGLPAGRGFMLTYPTGKISHPVLHLSCLGPDLAVRWQQQLVPKNLTYVKQITASDTHVWVVLEQYLSLLTRQPQVWNCCLATGETDCNTLLSPNEQVDAAVVVPAGLLLLGTVSRQYAPPLSAGQPKPQEWQRDVDVVHLLAPDGRQGPGLSLTWSEPGRPLHHWRHAYAQPDGSYQLIGETYRKVVSGASVALAMIGGGMLGTVGFGMLPTGYLNERPTGLVLARLGATGQLAAVQQLIVPETMHAAADSTTKLPTGRSTGFRFRGLNTSHSCVVLNTSRQVLLYSLATGQLMPLTPTRKATPTVLAIETDHVTIGWTTEGPEDKRPEAERVGLP